MNRFDEAWQEFHCSDCDPTLFPDEPSDYEKPYVMLVPEGEEAPDSCPRCGSHLSMMDGPKGLRITNTPEQRWAAQQQKESGDSKT